MHLIIEECSNPLRLESGSHDINIEPITEPLRDLFWRHLYGETHTCLLCRLKLLQELWVTEPERCDSTIMSIVREAEETINQMESDLVRIKKRNREDTPLR